MFVKFFWRDGALCPACSCWGSVQQQSVFPASRATLGPIPTNLFTFRGKICLFKCALQVISSQRNISTHVNRTNCQLNFDAIPPGCGGLCSDSKPGCSSLSNKTGLSSTRCLFECPWEKPGVASVHRPNVVWGVYLRVQTTGACRSVLQSSEDKMWQMG